MSVGVWRAFRPSLKDVLERGWLAYQQKDTEGVQRQLVLATHMAKNSAEVKLLRGALLICTDKPDLALSPLRDAASQSELRSRAQLMASRAYLDLHQFSAAEQVLSERLREDSEDVEAHRLLAVMYYDLGANPAAIEHLEAVVRLAPTDARPLRLIGLMRKDFQDYTAAVQAYREALRRKSDGPLAEEVRLELAQCLAELRKYDESLAALTPDLQSPDALAVRLLSYRALGRQDEARQVAERAAQIANPSLNLVLELGTYWDAMGDLKQASSYYEKAVELDRLDFIPRYKLSTVYARMGRAAEAAEQLETMQINRKRYDRLHELQNQAMREPHNAVVRYEMGVASLELGRPEMAGVWFLGALSLDPQHQAARAAIQGLPLTTRKKSTDRGFDGATAQ
jgi:tetratricopeptide (TPR) repeat protein